MWGAILLFIPDFWISFKFGYCISVILFITGFITCLPFKTNNGLWYHFSVSICLGNEHQHINHFILLFSYNLFHQHLQLIYMYLSLSNKTWFLFQVDQDFLQCDDFLIGDIRVGDFQGGTSVVVPCCSCCLCLYFGSAIMLVTHFVNFR